MAYDKKDDEPGKEEIEDLEKGLDDFGDDDADDTDDPDTDDAGWE